jgi:DNA-binding NarL/FixJ family response regulator
MIVEGNALFGQLLESMLHSQFPSMEFVATADEKEAMAKISSFLPDLAFIDVRLPDGRAFELIRKMKTHRPNVAVIALSSYDFPEYREEALQKGADIFISKDSAAGDYFQLIESILAARGPLPEGDTGVGPESGEA